MALLTSAVNATPAALSLIVEHVAADEGISAEALFGAMVPDVLRRDGAPDRQVTQSLSVAIDLGLVVGDSGGYALGIDDLRTLDDQRTLRRQLPKHVRRRLLDADRESARSASRDIVQALAWFHAQDAWSPPLGFSATVRPGVEVLQSQQFTEPRDAPLNKTGWDAFPRWATYLGLAAVDTVIGKDVLVPDPTQAVRDELVDVPRSGSKGLVELVKLLGERIPVLDGGAHRLQLQSRAPALEPEADRLSSSLSMALLRLDGERVLKLENPADSPPEDRRRLTSPSGDRVVARVTWSEGGPR